jgi:Methionyl-tRNA formyltransferase
MKNARGVELRQKVVVCGEKQVAQHCLDFLLRRNDTEVVAVITAANDWQADLLGWATEHQIRVFVGNVNNYRNELAEMGPDFLFSIQYRSLIKEPILAIPARGSFNLHFGMLPRYGGCYPVAWAILNGEEIAGVTLHHMTPRFDDGDIVAQRSVPITDNTTARELFDALSAAGAKLFGAVYDDLLTGKLPAKPQDLSQQLYYAKDSIDFKRDSLLDWRQPAREIQRRVCAFSFEPFQLPITGIRVGEAGMIRAAVSDTQVIPEQSSGIFPGEIVASCEDGSVLIKAGDAALICIRKLERQNAAEFIKQAGISWKNARFIKASLD